MQPGSYPEHDWRNNGELDAYHKAEEVYKQTGDWAQARNILKEWKDSEYQRHLNEDYLDPYRAMGKEPSMLPTSPEERSIGHFADQMGILYPGGDAPPFYKGPKWGPDGPIEQPAESYKSWPGSTGNENPERAQSGWGEDNWWKQDQAGLTALPEGPQLNWQDSNMPGRGILINNQLHTWPVDKTPENPSGGFLHSEYLKQHGINPLEPGEHSLSNGFEIDPGGTIPRLGIGLSPEELHYIQGQDPRLSEGQGIQQSGPIDLSMLGAVDPDKNPLRELIDNGYDGFIPQDSVEQALRTEAAHRFAKAYPLYKFANNEADVTVQPEGYHNGPQSELTSIENGAPGITINGQPWKPGLIPVYGAAGEVHSIGHPHPYIANIVQRIVGGDPGAFNELNDRLGGQLA